MEEPNSISFNINQESPLDLPLAPIISAPGVERRGNTTARGSAIFSPSTLDQPHQLMYSTSDPDPTTTRAGLGTFSNPNTSTLRRPQAAPPPAASTSSTTSSTKYKECLKNHAASLGNYVVDGCGEFMPSGDEGTFESMRCAACTCHRSFHRRVDALLAAGNPHNSQTISHNHRHQPFTAARTTPSYPVMMNFGGNSGGGATAESSSEDFNMFQSSPGGHAINASSSKKRFRTKFDKEQKDRMHEFADKLGWRIQRQDDEQVQQFCSEVGVKRQVFKVWMHNNKQAIKKRSQI